MRLPDYQQKGMGTKGDLAMVEGADTVLNHIAAGRKEVGLILSETPFQGKDELGTEALIDPVVSGGY